MTRAPLLFSSPHGRLSDTIGRKPVMVGGAIVPRAFWIRPGPIATRIAASPMAAAMANGTRIFEDAAPREGGDGGAPEEGRTLDLHC